MTACIDPQLSHHIRVCGSMPQIPGLPGWLAGYTLTTPFAAARLWLIHDPKSVRSSWKSRPEGR
jgi:hypothetical protein